MFGSSKPFFGVQPFQRSQIVVALCWMVKLYDG